MKLAILTYDHSHRKTQDLLFGLLAKGHKDILLIGYPYEQRSHKPLYPHRPNSCLPLNAKGLAETFGVDYAGITQYRELRFDVDYYLICGAGIIGHIPDKPIINSHPGYLPNVRGLDALKWAIYYDTIIGVTVHQISKAVDSGQLIKREEIIPEPAESFYHFAMRQYHMEIEMLVDYFAYKPFDDTKLIYTDHYVLDLPQKRMSHAQEIMMRKRFNK